MIKFLLLGLACIGLLIWVKRHGEEFRQQQRSYSGRGFDFDPKLNEPLGWGELSPLLRVHRANVSEVVKIGLGKRVPRPVTKNKKRTFGCLRDGCRGLEIEELLDRGWTMRFKTCLVNGTNEYKDINYHTTVLMADTTNLNHLKLVKESLFNKILGSYEGSTYVTAFLGGDAIGGNKGQQLRTKMKFAKKYKCSYNDLGIQPAQFRLYVENECEDLKRIGSQMSGQTWLLKPEAGSQGQGITFHDNVDDIQGKRPNFFPCADRKSLPATERALVQQYIQQPLLLYKCKFDVRVYMLIASSDPWMVFYHPGYLRRALWPYTPNSKDRKVYLTNTHFQSMKSGFKLSDHIWSFDAFQGYLSDKKITGAHYIDSMLNPYILSVAQYVFKSAVHKMTARRGSFQIFGLDFMIDQDFHVHFIEANGYPGFTWSINFDSRGMVEELYDLVQELNEHPDAFRLMRPGDHYATWQLVHSDIYQGKRGLEYNPCEEFVDNHALTAPFKAANKLFSKVSGTHDEASTEEYDRFVPRIPGWRYIGGEKGDTFGVRASFSKSCSSPYTLEPPTYRITKYKKHCEKLIGKEGQAYILKQVEGRGAGDGLVYFDSSEDIQGDPGLYPCKDGEETWLAQEYIPNPFKLDVKVLKDAEKIKLDFPDGADGIKELRKAAESMEEEMELINPTNNLYEGSPGMVQYDVRAYMLVASINPLMVFYHDGYLRSSRAVRFANGSFGFKLGEHVLSFESFQYYLASQQITGPHYVSSVLRPYLSKVMEYVLHSARAHIHQKQNTTHHHLFALNFVLDGDNLKPHLVGVSGDPTHTTDLVDEVSTDVKKVLDTLEKTRRELVVELSLAPAAFARMRYGDKYGTFSLVFSQLEEHRYNTTYDPCTSSFKTVPKTALKQTAEMQNYVAKQRVSHKREMDKYVKKRWASCIRGEVTYRYMVYVQKERIPYDKEYITNKIRELQGAGSLLQLPLWKQQQQHKP